MSLWGAVAYGVLPVVSGSVQEGRLGTVVGAAGAALAGARRAVPRARPRPPTAAAGPPGAPRLARAARPRSSRRPGCWPLVVARRRAGARASAAASAQGLAAGVVIPLVATLVLLLPWSVATWTHQGPASWLFEAGLPSPG